MRFQLPSPPEGQHGDQPSRAHGGTHLETDDDDEDSVRFSFSDQPDQDYEDQHSDEDSSEVDDFTTLFPSDRLPNSHLSVADAMVMAMAYTSSAGLNWTDMERLVHVINALLGAQGLPSSKYLLRKAWRKWTEQLAHRYYFCTNCSTRSLNPK